MGISHSKFNKAILVEEEKVRRNSMQMIALGVCYVFGVLLIFMALSFFYQALYPDITKNESKYQKKMEQQEKQVYDRRSPAGNCKRVCKSIRNPFYWILPI